MVFTTRKPSDSTNRQNSDSNRAHDTKAQALPRNQETKAARKKWLRKERQRVESDQDECVFVTEIENK